MNQPAPFTFPRFRITQLAYDSDALLRPAPADYHPRITRLFYAEPATDLVFAETDGNGLGVGVKSDVKHLSGPPARPPRPQYRLDRWGTEHGLPASKVRALHQTHDGYLWIGTVGGLARFDGARFTVFSETNCPEMRWEGSIGRAFFEDNERRLWIGTERGLLCRDGDRFVRFRGQEEFRGQIVNGLSRRGAGGFWIATDKGLACWDGRQLQRRDVEGRAGAGAAIHAVLETAPGRLCLANDHGVIEIELETGRTNRSCVEFEDYARGMARITALLQDRRGCLWFSGGVGLWRWEQGAPEPARVKQVPFGARGASAHSRFAQDSGGGVWMTGGGHRGVARFAGGSFDLAGTPDAIESLADTLAITVDQEGAVWIGAREGLFRLRRQPAASMALVATGPKLSLRTLAEESDGSLWFGDGNFYARWSGRDFTRLSFESLRDLQLSWPILCAGSNGVWMGGSLAGVFQLSESPASPGVHPSLTPLFARIGTATALLKARAGGLWIASDSGLYRTRDMQSLERIESLPPLDIRVLAEDSRTNLWIGTVRNGLYRLGENGAQPVPLPAALRNARILALHQSGDDSQWIGTSSGLALHHKGVASAFTIESGLPQSSIHSVLEDDQGRLWLNHDGGLSRVARRELETWLADAARLPAVAHLGAADGLMRVETDAGAATGLKGRDGRLWFLKRDCLVVVDPSEFPEAPAPVVSIETILAGGRAHAPGQKLELPADTDRNIEIWFTTPSLLLPEKVLLQYRLAGHDQDWRDVNGPRRASYSGLRPGRYQFHARARNHEGRWSERDAVLDIEVTASPWRSPWFYAATGLLAAGAMAGLVAWRLRRQRKRLRAEQQASLEQERRRIARDMHDHLGAHLAGDALAFGGNGGAHERARETLRELHDLIWSVQPDNDSLPSLMDFVANFSARFLSAAGVELDLDIAPDIPPVSLPGPFRHEVAAMLKEALRNVAQHAHARRVAVSLALRDQNLRLSIRDDGRGFAPAAAGGLGLRNLRSRAAALRGACRITSAPGGGTEVEILVPLPRPD